MNVCGFKAATTEAILGRREGREGGRGREREGEGGRGREREREGERGRRVRERVRDRGLTIMARSGELS